MGCIKHNSSHFLQTNPLFLLVNAFLYIDEQCFPVPPLPGSCLEGNCFVCGYWFIDKHFSWSKASTSEQRKSFLMWAKQLSSRHLLKQNIVWMLAITTSDFIKFSRWFFNLPCVPRYLHWVFDLKIAIHQSNCRHGGSIFFHKIHTPLRHDLTC